MVILVTSVMQPIDTPTAPTAIRATTLDIVIPVYNEEHDLEPCVRRLHAFLANEVPYSARITIADNASTDGTLKIAHRLSRELVGVDVLHLEEKGRGGHSRPPGCPRTPRWSPTAMWTCPPTSTRSCRWWRH